MFRKCFAILTLLAVLLPICGLAATISVTGSGEVSAQPDLVKVSTTISAREDSLQLAQSNIAGRVSAITEAVIALGIGEDDIVTSGYSVYPQWDYIDSVSTMTGYQASHSLVITCRDVTLLDAVVNALTDAGATQIDDISYASSATGELYLNALALAVTDARNKADALAAAGGMRVQSIVSMDESSVGGSSYRTAVMKAEAEDSAAGFATGIRSGSVTVSATVTIVFEAR